MSKTTQAAIAAINDSVNGLTPFMALAALQIVGNAIVTELLAEETKQLLAEMDDNAPTT